MRNETYIELKALSRLQLELLIVHYRELISLQAAANNELITRFHNKKILMDVRQATLREWSEVMNELNAASEVEVEKITNANAFTAAG